MKLKLLLASATLAAGATILNAADEKAFEKALLGHIMWSAFQCSTYAEMSDTLVDKSERERLHLVGLNAGPHLPRSDESWIDIGTSSQQSSTH